MRGLPVFWEIFAATGCPVGIVGAGALAGPFLRKIRSFFRTPGPVGPGPLAGPSPPPGLAVSGFSSPQGTFVDGRAPSVWPGASQLPPRGEPSGVRRFFDAAGASGGWAAQGCRPYGPSAVPAYLA